MVTAKRDAISPAAELRVSDLDTLRVLADPLRLRILETFGHHERQPLTVKEMARSLGEPVTKLYYHVNLMEQHGLVLVASSRLVSGILEKRYLPAAERFEVDKGILAAGTLVAHEAMRSVVSSVFQAAQADIEDAVHAGRARLDEAEDEGDGAEPVLLSKGLDRLTHAEAVVFRQRLQALFAEFSKHSGAAAGTGRGRRTRDGAGTDERHPFGLVLAFYPVAEPPRKTRRRRPVAPEEPSR
jgi:DNA-binding transcriptional ArsR family regulator